MAFNALRSLTTLLECILYLTHVVRSLRSKHFAKLCKSVYPWESGKSDLIYQGSQCILGNEYDV